MAYGYLNTSRKISLAMTVCYAGIVMGKRLEVIVSLKTSIINVSKREPNTKAVLVH